MLFLDLPDDVIRRVLDFMLRPNRFDHPFRSVSGIENYYRKLVASFTPCPVNSIQALSMTCKLMRTICSPLMFQEVFFGLIEDLPRSSVIPDPYVLQRVRSLLVTWDRPDRQLPTTAYHEMMQSMPQLREIVWQSLYGSGTIPVELSYLAAFLSNATLESITLINVPLKEGGFRPEGFCSKLRTFRYIFAERARLRSVISGQRDYDVITECRCLEGVLDQLRATLECLVIPGEITYLSFLAKAPWPHLLEFSLVGDCPVYDASILSVITLMPRLRSLALAVLPPLDAPHMIIVSGRTDEYSHIDFPYLRRLTLSFPSNNDQIFARLPLSIRSLSLRDTPRYYLRRFSRKRQLAEAMLAPAPLLSCSSAIRILEAMARGGSATCLRELELVVRWDDSNGLRMIRTLSASCQSLQFLDLHCYRNVDEDENLWRDETILPVADIARALATLPALETLRLNLDFPFIYGQYTQYENFNSVRQFYDEQALIVARELSSLDTIALFALGLAPGFPCWIIWAPDRAPDGTTTINRVVDYGDVYDLNWL